MFWKTARFGCATSPPTKLGINLKLILLRRIANFVTAGATNSQANNAVYQQDTIGTIANFATATFHDRQAVSTLTATKGVLTKELALVNAKLFTGLLANTQLTSQLGAGTGSTASTPCFEARHCCWSCGYTQTHFSSQCPNPKTGHQKGAKAADTMGGSTANRN